MSLPTSGVWAAMVWETAIVLVGGDSEDIADFHWDEQETVNITRDEAVANARLCAAAPDLLEALKAFVIETVDYMTINKLGDPEQQHNVKLARAALSKAGDVA